MSRSRRWSLVAAGALALQLSCGREVTGPWDGLRREVVLSLAPEFPRATLADSLRLSTVVPFDRVRVTAWRSDQTVAYDRTVSFPANADSVALTVGIPVPQDAVEGVGISVGLAYVNTQGDTVFRGGPLSAFVTASGPSQPVAVPVRYTGVGSQATRVVMTPDTGTVLPGTTTTFTAQARDSSAAIAGTPLYFYTPDTARALIANPAAGSVLWKASRGTARIIALHPSGALADTSVFAVTLPASRLVVASGAAQSALASTALPQPIVLRTLAADSVPVPGVVVSFAVATGGGTLSVLTDTSDATGTVSTSWTLGTTIGAQSITATAAGLTPSPLTIGATAISGPTGFAINITSPVSAKRYYAIVDGGTLTSEIVAKVDPLFARTATLTVPVPAGTGYSVYVLAVDSLSTLPDTLPIIAAGAKLANLTIPAGNTIPVSATLQPMSLTGTVPSTITAGEPFTADVTMTDPSLLFYELVTSATLLRSDTLVSVDRTGSGVAVGGVQVLNATQKRFTGTPFRPTAAGSIYSQYAAGIVTTDRRVIFLLLGPSLQRGESLLATTVAAATTGIQVSVTSPIPVTRFVVGVDTGTGPIAWGGTTGVGLTSATIQVPVPAGTNYRVRVAALDDFGFSSLTNANLAGLRAGNVAFVPTVTAGNVTNIAVTLVAQSTAAGVPATAASGATIPFSGTMVDPSRFNTTVGCLLRYSTAGPITNTNLGTLVTNGCTISNRSSADGSYSVAGSFPAVTGPATLYTHVFTSVIGYQANGARVEMVHQNIATTTISAP